MTPRERKDTMWRVIFWPGWIVVGLAITGVRYADNLTAQVQEVREKIIPLAEIRRELDSLRIESRHTTETLEEIRHLLARPSRARPAQTDLLR